ncbi:MAG TPA: hypothetical protein VFT66_01430 [Roseiflexaceae bacterium]|nr:hypothetical protein [Roseiflexaceae bacterium]
MTQRERSGPEKVEMYDAPDSSIPGRRVPERTSAPVPARPTDLVRWGPIIAGIFAALATLATLSILGIAIGLSVFNYGDPASSFGIGAGIWGAITALISFFVGGLIAARTAAISGRTSGIMNGAMVWFVAVPLLIYLLGSGIGSLTRTVGSVAGTAAQTAGNVVGAAASNPAVQGTAVAGANNPAVQATAGAGVQNVEQAAQATAQALQQQAPQIANQVADTGARAAWGTLLSLGLAAAAAIGGGVVGARPRGTSVARA